MELCRVKLKFANCLTVDASGHSGGLALLWKKDVKLEVISYSSSHIDAWVEEDSKQWFLTRIYGQPKASRRIETWNLIRGLPKGHSDPWLVFGDFNEIPTQREKWGGRNRLVQQMLDFYQLLSDSNLKDIGFSSQRYTWCNKREDSALVSERLNKFLGNLSWCNMFGRAAIFHGFSSSSDHLPLWVDIRGVQPRRRRPKPFRFKAMWFNLGEKVEDSRVVRKILRSPLERFRPKVTVIEESKDLDAIRVEELEHLGNFMLDNIDNKVTEEMNADLIKPYSVDEVSRAMKEMHPSKAPGPDGMPPLFFQQYWPKIGNSIFAAVLHALNSSDSPQVVNHTYIIMVPKKKNLVRVNDFRPNSLYNVIYKLISKVIANKIKYVLPTIISKTQSAFLPGRLISDNVLVAYEVLHFFKRKMTGKKGYLSLKVDMSKAYDRVE
ncbi:hypothetical protein F2P56_000925 [Juglans regia]|uniref:Reverse transcriptase domain-containing protein n=2 Tax=Juglans regia TaxID=51240 RepID=A0A834D3J0_JUGRE|nr:uncharacterized protein LOC108987980 [Juglans regia]KAF5480159.1 hypothetical protein F2P56_000925 [Juglans regia]